MNQSLVFHRFFQVFHFCNERLWATDFIALCVPPAVACVSPHLHIWMGQFYSTFTVLHLNHMQTEKLIIAHFGKRCSHKSPFSHTTHRPVTVFSERASDYESAGLRVSLQVRVTSSSCQFFFLAQRIWMCMNVSASVSLPSLKSKSLRLARVWSVS